MGAVEACRTAALGGHIERCTDCGLIRIAYNSCRNRHCPKCQGPARAAWLAERQAELLPVPYYHVVFTIPAPAAEIAFQNKAAVYAILFKAAAETLGTIAADPHHLGAEIGFVAVLHTWGQNLQHHPHVHCLVPGGGLSADGTRWISCRPGFFLPVRVLSRLFRRLFLEKLGAAFEAGRLGFFGTLAQLADPPMFARHLAELRRGEWVVYAKRPFAGPAAVLTYREESLQIAFINNLSNAALHIRMDVCSLCQVDRPFFCFGQPVENVQVGCPTHPTDFGASRKCNGGFLELPGQVLITSSMATFRDVVINLSLGEVSVT